MTGAFSSSRKKLIYCSIYFKLMTNKVQQKGVIDLFQFGKINHLYYLNH
jgi:hypothetical protein